mgnify:CR=1 FL=1
MRWYLVTDLSTNLNSWISCWRFILCSAHRTSSSKKDETVVCGCRCWLVPSSHTGRKKYIRTAKARGLNGLRTAKKDAKNLQELKKALTKIIIIQTSSVYTTNSSCKSCKQILTNTPSIAP